MADDSRFSNLKSPSTPLSPFTSGTPLFGRSVSSNFNSPGATFRTDDELFVLEFSSRYMRAGLAGENQPRCRLSFGPEEQRRVGNYERWLPHGRSHKRRKVDKLESWGQDHELWQMDLRNVDLELIGNKIERATREAITEHILIMDESKKRRFVVVVPPVLPHPLLSTLLTTLFVNFPPLPSITLLSTALLNTVAAGLRSALIVDIGWAETVISAVYEYKELQHERSSRGMKLLSWEVRRMLESEIREQIKSHKMPTSEESIAVSLEDTEDVLTRVVWCEQEEKASTSHSDKTTSAERHHIVAIPLLSTKPSTTVHIPFTHLALPVEHIFFASKSQHDCDYDDNELPLPMLLYSTLQSLPIDVRQNCLHRIVITGGGSNIPGLKSRLLYELRKMIQIRGWDRVSSYGSATSWKRGKAVLSSPSVMQESEQGFHNRDLHPDSDTPTHLQPPLPDPILAAIQSRSVPFRSPPKSEAISDQQSVKVSPQVRGVLTLGAWAGASMIAGLHVQGLVEVERESFIEHGLAGADKRNGKRESVEPRQHERRSLLGLAEGGMGKISNVSGNTWSLGIWA